ETAGVEFWLNFLNQGGTLAQLESQFAGSKEDFDHWGKAEKQLYLQNLYRDVLQRELDPAGLQFLGNAPHQGAPPSAVALGVATSAEGEAQAVQNWYSYFLHQQADPQSVSALVATMQAGTTHEQVIANVAAQGLNADKSGPGTSLSTVTNNANSQQLT